MDYKPSIQARKKTARRRLGRRGRLAAATAVAILGALVAAAALAGSATGGERKVAVRWDIVSIAGGNLQAGGAAEALANDNSKITVTGHGTFRAKSDRVHKASGGGTWETRSPTGTVTGSGTYRVTRVLSWIQGPGTPPPLPDLIGNPNERSPGLAYLRIAYSDGSTGVLIVSCRLVGTPTSVFEGINASKNFVDYTHNVEPVSGVDLNRTLFHVGAGKDKDDDDDDDDD